LITRCKERLVIAADIAETDGGRVAQLGRSQQAGPVEIKEDALEGVLERLDACRDAGRGRRDLEVQVDPLGFEVDGICLEGAAGVAEGGRAEPPVAPVEPPRSGDFPGPCRPNRNRSRSGHQLEVIAGLGGVENAGTLFEVILERSLSEELI